MFDGVMFYPLCRNAMNYEKFEDTYRCTKTNFYPNRNVIVTTGLTRFKGRILKQDDDIEKSHVLLILKTGNGVHEIIKGSESRAILLLTRFRRCLYGYYNQKCDGKAGRSSRCRL